MFHAILLEIEYIFMYRCWTFPIYITRYWMFLQEVMHDPLRAKRALMLHNDVPKSLYKISMVIVSFWFSMEHRWTAIMPFWLLADNTFFTIWTYCIPSSRSLEKPIEVKPCPELIHVKANVILNLGLWMMLIITHYCWRLEAAFRVAWQTK